MKKPTQTFQAPIILIYCALVLSLMEYLLIPPRAESWINGPGPYGWLQPSLSAGLIWAASCIVFFSLLPFLFIKFFLKEDLKNYGVSFKGFLDHIKTYFALYLAMTPLIYFASTQPHFLKTYPFIPEAKISLQTFLIWEAAYILQFFALESFFRGSLLFTLEKYTDKWIAIAMMTLPYTMIHFHKPMLETFGAIFAGLFLGWLALRFRSWLGGAVLHSLVAVTMDTLAVYRAGLF